MPAVVVTMEPCNSCNCEEGREGVGWVGHSCKATVPSKRILLSLSPTPRPVAPGGREEGVGVRTCVCQLISFLLSYLLWDLGVYLVIGLQ